MSNLSRYQGRARREARKAAYSIRNNYVPSNRNNRIRTVQKKSFLEYVLQDSDIMICCDPDYILPSVYLWSKYMVKNDVFNTPNQKISADKIGIIWSQRKKMYMMIAINDNSDRLFILFKNKELRFLPNVESRLSNLEKVDTVNIYQTVENSNRMMNVVFNEVYDLTSNPVMIYKVSELFRK